MNKSKKKWSQHLGSNRSTRHKGVTGKRNGRYFQVSHHFKSLICRHKRWISHGIFGWPCTIRPSSWFIRGGFRQKFFEHPILGHTFDGFGETQINQKHVSQWGPCNIVKKNVNKRPLPCDGFCTFLVICQGLVRLRAPVAGNAILPLAYMPCCI